MGTSWRVLQRPWTSWLLAVAVVAGSSLEVAWALAPTASARASVAPAAPAKKRAPKITGLSEDGQLLSVSEGAWKGTPPLSFAYEWEACSKSGDCSTLPGANGASYRVVSSEIGARLKVIVTASNAAGSAVAISHATKKIKPGPPVGTAVPGISGSLLEGQTLSASTGNWAGTAPFAFGYQWQRCSALGGGCEDIPGATGPTYTLGFSDLASQLAVVVVATNAQGSASATSAETGGVEGLLPSNSVLPAISGVLQEGQLLSVGAGSWSGTGPISFGYQWRLCDALGEGCTDIAEATGSSLKLTTADIGSTLEVVVKATNVAGSTSVTTPVTGLIEGLLPSNSVLPAISGVLRVGQLLSASAGTWSGTEPISYTYQWQLCNLLGGDCANIDKATSSTFLLGVLDVGLPLRVVVRATNVAGSASASSNGTGLVEGLL